MHKLMHVDAPFIKLRGNFIQKRGMFHKVFKQNLIYLSIILARNAFHFIENINIRSIPDFYFSLKLEVDLLSGVLKVGFVENSPFRIQRLN